MKTSSYYLLKKIAMYLANWLSFNNTNCHNVSGKSWDFFAKDV